MFGAQDVEAPGAAGRQAQGGAQGATPPQLPANAPPPIAAAPGFAVPVPTGGARDDSGSPAPNTPQLQAPTTTYPTPSDETMVEWSLVSFPIGLVGQWAGFADIAQETIFRHLFLGVFV